MPDKDGAIRQGRRATIRDVAAAADVSMGTVSRVVAGNPRISEATRQRVLAVMAELAYQPNAAARAMRTRSSHTVGLLIPDMACPIFTRVAIGAEAVLSGQGYMLITVASNRRRQREVEFIQAARQRQMDGLIVSVADEAGQDTIRELRTIGIPIVVLDREIPLDADFIFCEHYQAMKTVVRNLIALGHERIGLVCAAETIRPGRERLRAYRDALTEAELEIDPTLMRATGQGTAYGEAETQALLLGADAPTALIAAGSDTFCGALRAIRGLDLRIPEDISLVGADDTDLGEVAGPAITMIERDMQEVGNRAAVMLLERLGGLSLPPRRVLLNSRVVLRNSVAPRPAAARVFAAQ